MVIDPSAVLAILQREPESERFAALIEAAPIRLISAVSLLEAGMIAEVRKGEAGALELDNFILRGQLQTVPFDAEQADGARLAFRRFGKGQHPASLNFGDCAAYALAKSRGEPLLFKGEDFSKTDIEHAAT
ncbi:MAG: type II toxin-antitoxin system VapC family toxin [Alphaproteobacteria bacterium GM202ARS2]|nr:type II toxin-antitoxin system VapC family toxin [Alphaproteobacteria bacterium GM202ARS2]